MALFKDIDALNCLIKVFNENGVDFYFSHSQTLLYLLQIYASPKNPAEHMFLDIKFFAGKHGPYSRELLKKLPPTTKDSRGPLKETIGEFNGNGKERLVSVITDYYHWWRKNSGRDLKEICTDKGSLYQRVRDSYRYSGRGDPEIPGYKMVTEERKRLDFFFEKRV